MPRPTRTLRCREPRGGRRLDRFTAMFASIPSTLLHFDQVTHLVDHPANRGCIMPLYHLLHAMETQAADGLPHILRATDEAAPPLDSQRTRFIFCLHSRLILFVIYVVLPLV